jgi:hypothetical protein
MLAPSHWIVLSYYDIGCFEEPRIVRLWDKTVPKPNSLKKNDLKGSLRPATQPGVCQRICDA